jgi:hypothetical protein
MAMRAAGMLAALGWVSGWCAPAPQAWVPMRWPWQDARSLELLAGTPINCLLLETYSPELVTAASKRGLVTLAQIAPGGDAVAEARGALARGVSGIVLEGSFAEGIPAAVRAAAGSAPVVEITARNRLALGSSAQVLATDQGVWPGIPAEDGGHSKMAGPSGSAWINTNTGFIRAVRAWGDAAVWLANAPPAGEVVTAERYLQAIADAAISGGRWVIALDHGFAGRLAAGDENARAGWQRMAGLLAYFERHPEWRAMRAAGKLALVQDPAKGGLLSGGILDMIAVKHTPVTPVPPQRLTPEALAGTTVAVDVDAGALTAPEQTVLRDFAHAGGTVLTSPTGFKDERPPGDSITLTKAELERFNDIWHDVNSLVGRENLGVRLFNVSSMLSNVLASADGKTEIVHLVNYSDYAVENVTVQFLGNYRHATLLTPDGGQKALEVYPADEASAVDIDKVAVCATIKLEP